MQAFGPDDYLTDEEKEAERKIERLKLQAQQGALFADWLRAPATIILLQMLDGQIGDAKNAWLAAKDRDAAEVVRIQSQVYLKIKQWIGSQVQAGKVAEAGLAQFQEEGITLSNVIGAPQSKEKYDGR